ncbi:MAG TPA: DUF4296 domain-containing protein [Cyclobacteriaceae bacterium]
MSNLDAYMGLSTANLINGMRRGASFFLLLTIIFSCQKEKRPAGIMSHEEMAAVIVDIYLAEARLNGSLMVRDSARRVFKPFEDKLLSQKGVNDSILKKSYVYYLNHSSELEKIYDSVIDTLALQEQRVKRLTPTP